MFERKNDKQQEILAWKKSQISKKAYPNRHKAIPLPFNCTYAKKACTPAATWVTELYRFYSNNKRY